MSIIASSIMVTQFRIHTETVFPVNDLTTSTLFLYSPCLKSIHHLPIFEFVAFGTAGILMSFFLLFFLHLPKFYIWGILNIIFYNSLTTLSLNVPNQKLFEILMSCENNNTSAGINTNGNEKYLTYSFWHVLN